MGLWFFLFLCALLIPAAMIFFGWVFMKKPPKDINSLFGYRTARSMKNRSTWIFAHQYAGRIWFRMGLLLLPLSALSMLFCIGGNADQISTVNIIITVAQIPFMVSTIFFTERALKRNFDPYGRKKDTA